MDHNIDDMLELWAQHLQTTMGLSERDARKKAHELYMKGWRQYRRAGRPYGAGHDALIRWLDEQATSTTPSA